MTCTEARSRGSLLCVPQCTTDFKEAASPAGRRTGRPLSGDAIDGGTAKEGRGGWSPSTGTSCAKQYGEQPLPPRVRRKKPFTADPKQSKLPSARMMARTMSAYTILAAYVPRLLW